MKTVRRRIQSLVEISRVCKKALATVQLRHQARLYDSENARPNQRAGRSGERTCSDTVVGLNEGSETVTRNSPIVFAACT